MPKIIMLHIYFAVIEYHHHMGQSLKVVADPSEPL